MDSPSFAIDDAEYVLRRLVRLSILVEGVSWTVSVLRAHARQIFEDANIEFDSTASLSLEHTSRIMCLPPPQVSAYAYAAGLRSSGPRRETIEGIRESQPRVTLQQAPACPDDVGNELCDYSRPESSPEREAPSPDDTAGDATDSD